MIPQQQYETPVIVGASNILERAPEMCGSASHKPLASSWAHALHDSCRGCRFQQALRFKVHASLQCGDGVQQRALYTPDGGDDPICGHTSSHGPHSLEGPNTGSRCLPAFLSRHLSSQPTFKHSSSACTPSMLDADSDQSKNTAPTNMDWVNSSVADERRQKQLYAALQRGISLAPSEVLHQRPALRIFPEGVDSMENPWDRVPLLGATGVC
jgi:hypothetical protein